MSTAIIPCGLSEQYWSRLSPKDQELYHLVRPQPKSAYEVDVQLGHVEDFILAQQRDLPKMGGSFELTPDFQREHVWTDVQRIAYVEAIVRGTAPTRILFNCPGWSNATGANGDIKEHTFECIDGLQRLTAVRKFLAGEFSVFGGLSAADLKGTPFDVNRFRFQFCVYEFLSRSELLQFYLDLNTGGTVHKESELARVRQLLADSLNQGILHG